MTLKDGEFAQFQQGGFPEARLAVVTAKPLSFQVQPPPSTTQTQTRQSNKLGCTESRACGQESLPKQECFLWVTPSSLRKLRMSAIYAASQLIRRADRGLSSPFSLNPWISNTSPDDWSVPAIRRVAFPSRYHPTQGGATRT